jgi:ATP-dependent DNA helicase RecG
MNKFISTDSAILPLKYIQYERENQYFDRKSARKNPKEISKHLIAFANANGGILVIGVEDDGSITGFEGVGLHKIDSFRRIPFEYLKTPARIKCEKVKVKNLNDKDDWILIYQIEPSTKRVIRSTSDDVYLRIGDQSRELTHEEINNLEFDKGERYFEEEIVDRSSIEDIDTELLETYKSTINTNLSNEEILEGRGLLVDGKLTVAGVLLFSKNPSKFFPNARLRFLRYDGIKAQTGERINLTKDINIDGPIPRIIEESKRTISSQLRDFQTLDATGKFKAVPEYPEFAWLEGIVNALTHRDYSQQGEHIKVIMYDDRLEISSPGKLPNIVDLSNMKYTRYSRNPIIARVLSELGWVKELNEGVKRIYEEMENYFLKAPEYSEPNGNSVLLKLENNYVMRQIRNSEYMERLFSDGIWDSLSDDEKTIIYIAYREGNITTKRVAEVLGRSIGYCRKQLNNLRNLDILLWVGTSSNDPTQYYKLNVENEGS